MNPKNKFIWLLALLTSLAFFEISCGGQNNYRHKTIFNLNLDAGVTSLDPAFSRNQNNIWCVNQLFNGLLQLDSNMRAIPCIAKRYDISEDLLTYTFYLRNDVYFHNDPLFKNGKGRKANAQDVKYSFERIIDPKIASSGAWIFNDKIEGPQSFKVINDSTIQIILRKTFPAFPELLTTQYCSIVPMEVAKFYGKDFRNHPIGTGPFYFKYWKEGEIMAFIKNENYFEKDAEGKKLPYLDAVKISFISDKQTAFLEFIKKKLDFFSGIDGSYKDDILTGTGKLQNKYKGKFTLQIAPYLNTEYLGMLVNPNLEIVKKSPFKFRKFRQAINYAINKKEMIRFLNCSVGTPGNAGFVPLGMPGFDSTKVKGYSYNPKKAKELLNEIGFFENKNIDPITITTTTTYKALIEFVQGELTKVGIPTKVEVTQGASLREMISKNNINFFRGSWIADYPDAENYLSVFYSKNFVPAGPNYTHYYNKKFDALFEESFKEKDIEKRHILFQKMDQMVMDDAPVVILYYDQSVRCIQNNIKGLNNNAINLLNLKNVKKVNFPKV